MDKAKERDRTLARNAGVIEARVTCKGHEGRAFAVTFITADALGTFGVAACCERAATRRAAGLLTGEERQRAYAKAAAAQGVEVCTPAARECSPVDVLIAARRVTLTDRAARGDA